MNDQQVNKLRSYVSIEGVMEDEKVTLEKYPRIKKTWDDVSTRLKGLKAIAVDQGMDFRGVTSDKNSAKHKMAGFASKIAGCGSSYAKSINDQELATKLNLSKFKILQYSEERAIALSKMVLKECGNIIDKLEDMMVAPKDLVTLDNYISRFEGLRNKRGSANSTSKVNTELVDKMIKEISNILKDHLDKFVNRIDDEEPVFHRKYYVARNIRDLGRGPGGKGEIVTA